MSVGPIPASAYPLIRALVPGADEAGHMAFVHALLDGTMPGRVLADDADRPRSAIILPDNGFCFAIGAPDETLVAATVPGILAQPPPEPALLWASTGAWAAVLGRHLKEPRTRNEYHYLPMVPQPAPRPPPGFRLRAIDLEVANDPQFGKGLDPWVVRIWGGPAQFVERCFGWAVMSPEGLAAICTACSIGGGEAEVEIGTAFEYRERGLAYAAALAFFAECGSRNLRPAWTCATGNAGSERLAEKLGFVLFREVTGYPLN